MRNKIVYHSIPLDCGWSAELTMPETITERDVDRLQLWLDFQREALTTPVPDNWNELFKAHIDAIREDSLRRQVAAEYAD